MEGSTWLLVAAIALVVVGVVVVGVIAFLVQRSRREPLPEREHTPEVSAGPPAAASPFPVAGLSNPEVLTRDSLAHRSRQFDPRQWDDRPDGVEGTDMGLIGGDEGAAPPRGGGVDSSFIDSLRARKADES